MADGALDSSGITCGSSQVDFHHKVGLVRAAAKAATFLRLALLLQQANRSVTRSIGRPPSAPTAVVRLPTYLLEMAEAWSSKNAEPARRSTAIRQLVEMGEAVGDAMELKEFVSATLQHIVAGIRDAQSTEDGGLINAENKQGIPLGKNVFKAGTFGAFTIVEFDVAVSAEKGGKGGANLTVFGIGLEGGGDFKAGTANRIQFAIPVKIPDGTETERRQMKAR